MVKYTLVKGGTTPSFSGPYAPGQAPGIPSGYVQTTQQFIGGEIRTVDASGQVLDIRSGSVPSPGQRISPGRVISGGRVVSTPQRLTIQRDPRLGQSVSDVVRQSNVELAKVKQYISEVEGRTGEKFADSIARQGQTDVGASALLSRIASKKAQERIDAEIVKPLEQTTQKAKTLEEDVQKYTDTYIGRGLTQSEFDTAQKIQSDLIARQQALEKEFSRLAFEERVAQVREQQRFQDQQERLKLQASGQATIQELIRSGVGKPPIIQASSMDSKTPVIVTKPFELKTTSEGLKENIAPKLSAPQTLIERLDLGKKPVDIVQTEKEFKERIAFDQPLRPSDRIVLKPSIVESRKVLGKIGSATFDTLLLATPWTLVAKSAVLAPVVSGAKTLLRATATPITIAAKAVPSISKTGLKLKQFVEPTIRFKKYGDLFQTGAVSGKKIVVEGRGKLLFEEAGLMAKLKASVTRQPVKFTPKELPISFSLETSKKYAVNVLGKTKLSPTGSPITMQGLLPEERFLSLLKEKFRTTKALKGRAGFETTGFLEVGKGREKDVRLIKSFVDASTKKVKVGTGPIGISGTGTTFKFRLLNVGEDALVSAKVRGGISPMFKGPKATAIGLERKTGQIVSVKKDGLITRFIQKTRSSEGPRFNIFSEFVEGKARLPFDFGKVKALGKKVRVDSLTKPKVVVGKPITKESKEMFRAITAKPLKEGKWAFKSPKLNVDDFLTVKKVVEPVERVFRLPKPDSPGLKIYKLVKGQLRRVNKPVAPKPVTKQSKALFKYLSAKKTPSLFKLKRKEVKAIDLVRKPVTSKSKELFKFLSDVSKQEAGRQQLTTIGKVITTAKTKPKQVAKMKLLDALKTSSDTAISKELVASVKTKAKQKAIAQATTASKLSLFSGLDEDVEIAQVIPSQYASPRVSQSLQNLTITSSSVKAMNLSRIAAPTKQVVLDRVKTVSGQKVIPQTRVAEVSSVRTVSGQKVIPQTRVAQATRQATRLAQVLKTRTLTRTAVKQTVPSITRPVVRTPPVKIPVPIPLLGFRLGGVRPSKKKKGLIELFDVEVRRKGKFIKVGKALPKGIAKIKGKTIVGETAARTFKLTPVGVGKKRDVKRPIDLSQFRSPKGKTELPSGLVFVEKAKFAISSPGEKREIPGRAAMLRRSKALRVFG